MSPTVTFFFKIQSVTNVWVENCNGERIKRVKRLGLQGLAQVHSKNPRDQRPGQVTQLFGLMTRTSAGKCVQLGK